MPEFFWDKIRPQNAPGCLAHLEALFRIRSLLGIIVESEGYMTKVHQRIAAFAFGVLFVIVLLVLAIAFPRPTPFQYQVFMVVLALAAAGVAAMLPGFIEVNIPNWLKAGGALAVFALVMYKNPAGLVSVPPPEPTKGSALLMDGYRAFNESGYEFATRNKVAWDAGSADILAAKKPSEQTTGFFLPYDAEGYKNPDWDRDARAGIRPVTGSNLDDVHECPTGAYEHHWFQPRKGALYCLRSRDGKHYAVIRVDVLDEDRIGFDYIYQPTESARF